MITPNTRTVTVLRKKWAFEEPEKIEVKINRNYGWHKFFEVGDIIIDNHFENSAIWICKFKEGEKHFEIVKDDSVLLNDTSDPRDVRHPDDDAVILQSDTIEYFSDMSDDVEEFGNHIFHNSNCPLEADPDVVRPYDNHRSMSVGDAVVKGRKIAVCASFGWTVYDARSFVTQNEENWKDLGERIQEAGEKMAKRLAGA